MTLILWLTNWPLHEMAKIWKAIFFKMINLNDNVGIFIQVTLRSLDMSPTYTFIQWGRTTYICISKLTIIGSDNGLSPGRHQAIIWTIARILLMNASSAKWQPSCLGLNELSENYSLDNGWLQDSQWAMIRINNDLNSTVSYCVTRTQWVNNCKIIHSSKSTSVISLFLQFLNYCKQYAVQMPRALLLIY